MKPLSKQAVDETLAGIERASTHPRELAKVAIQKHQNRQQLTQQMIDSGYDEDERRRFFVGKSLRFRKRGFFSRLFG